MKMLMSVEEFNKYKKYTVKALRRAGLYKGRYHYSNKVNTPNQLLYWKNLILFDFKENPVQHDSWDNSGTELCRTISLKINMGKFTQKFGNCMVTIPPSHIKLLWGNPPKIRDYDEQVMSETDEGNWIIKKVARTYYTATAKAINLPKQIPLKDVFRHYVESNLSFDSLRREQIEHPSRYGYEMEIPGTSYVLKFFITGSIYSIHVVKDTQENSVSIPDILKMNHWASIELKDIVERASICRKVEREYEPDDECMETEIAYDCTI